MAETESLLSTCCTLSSTNKSDRYDIIEILMKVALNTIKPNQTNCINTCFTLSNKTINQ